ncbi:MAG: PTS system mannose/fructose/sorbose family transporter subunit IID [Desulfurococcaceae archaeon]
MHGHGNSVIKTLLLVTICLVIAMAIRVVEAQAGVTHPTPISLLELFGIIIVLLIAGLTFLGYNAFGLTEPLLIGNIIGLILGIPQVALPLSAMLELVYLGVFPVGGAAAPNAVVATITSLMFAKILGYTTVTSVELGTLMAIAIPIGMLAMYLEVVGARAGCVIYSHWADREIEKGNIGRLGIIAFLGSLQWFVVYMIPILAIAALGMSQAAVETIRVSLENPALQKILSALGVGAALMPAVGLGLLLKLTYGPGMLPWFILGYVLAAYLKLPILGITLLIISLILAIHWRELYEALQAPSTMSSTPQSSSSQVFTKSDFIKTYLKITFADQWAWNYERMQGTAYAFVMNHVERKLRKDPEELKSWMRLHNEFFNTQPLMTAMIVGVNMAVEEGGADQETVRSLKTSLMGPLAGLGDGLFWFTWRPIAFGIGAGLTLTAGALGPIVAFILWCPLVMTLGWYLLKLGYRYGFNMVSVIKGGRIEIIRRIASMIAVAIIAALGVSYIAVSVPVKIAVPEAQPINIQAAIDMIMPRLIPLIFLLGSFYMYRKGLSITKVLAIYFLIGVVLGLLGILSTG